MNMKIKDTLLISSVLIAGASAKAMRKILIGNL